MVGGQLADEDAIFNDALYAILNAIAGFHGRTEGEAVSYCSRAVVTKLFSYTRTANGRLLFIGGETSRVSGYEEDPGEESLGKEIGSTAIAQPHALDPEAAVLRKEIQQLVRNALDHLSAKERALIERVKLQNERIVDIAREIQLQNNLPETELPTLQNTLTQTIIRAVRKLKQCLPADLKEYLRQGKTV